MLLLAFLAMFFNCTTEDPVVVEEEPAFTFKPKPGETATLVHWSPHTPILERAAIRAQYEHLFVAWGYCDFDTEIWWDYCKGCRPFQDPLNDPSGRIAQTEVGVFCPE